MTMRSATGRMLWAVVYGLWASLRSVHGDCLADAIHRSRQDWPFQLPSAPQTTPYWWWSPFSSTSMTTASRRSLRSSPRQLQDSKPLLADSFGGKPGFYHSVASGDPLADSVIIWTRYTPVLVTDVIRLEFRIAQVDPTLNANYLLDPSKNTRIKRGYVNVEASSDWVAKIDVRGLQSNTAYVYAFLDNQQQSSPVGSTKTAPAPSAVVTSMRYAVFTCSSFPSGYFHAYDLASTIKDLDVWFHVGDWFYEGDPGTSGRGALILPKKEIVTLQDYRLRYATYIQGDEALQLLRRKVPFMGSWDDHEVTNNGWYGGAGNHQPDTEGDWTLRVNSAFKAYMEWNPLRWQPGTTGMISLGSFTQIVEWGSLATLITFDTRVTARSYDPTINNAVPYIMMYEVVKNYPNVRDYKNPKSKAYSDIRDVAVAVQAMMEDPDYVMVGPKNLKLLNDTFSASARAGKPWQIWAANVMMGPSLAPDPDYIVKELGTTPTKGAVARAYINLAYLTNPGIQLRALHAMALFDVRTNRDGFDGFSYERSKMLKIAEDVANNMIVLSGDVHDTLAWTLYENGQVRGKPVAVNLVTPGVTASGLGDTFLEGFVGPMQDYFGIDEIERASNTGSVVQMNGLKTVNYFDQGFFAVHMTQYNHIAEFFQFKDATIAKDYATARQESGGLTAAYNCSASLETRAGEKGSLDARPQCGAITFESQRSALLNIPVPASTKPIVGFDPLTDCGYKNCVVTL